MSREILITLLGLVVIVLPFLGIPEYIKNPLFVVLGTMIAALGIAFRHARYRRSITRAHGELKSVEFSESASAPHGQGVLRKGISGI